MDWILENKEWLFSGVAVAIPLAIIGWIISRKIKTQKQKSGNKSTNIQVGGDFTINSKGKKK